jgi:hypothetical protein
MRHVFKKNMEDLRVFLTEEEIKEKMDIVNK